MNQRPQRLLQAIAALIFACLVSGCVHSGPRELRVLSYNIRHGEGMDRKIDLERIAVFIRGLNPDVVLLQEVDQGCGRTGGVMQSDELGRLTGMRPFFAKFMDWDGGEYGMSLLTRVPVIREERIVLPDGDEPRSSSVVTIRALGGKVTLANIHFYRNNAERLAQAQALDQALSGTKHPVVWVGDFNSMRGDPVMSWLEKDYFIPLKDGPPDTFPADSPVREIDFIIFRKSDALAVKEHRVIAEPVLSDHRPVWMVLRRQP